MPSPFIFIATNRLKPGRLEAYAQTLDATVRIQVFGEPTEGIVEMLRQQAGSGVEISLGPQRNPEVSVR